MVKKVLTDTYIATIPHTQAHKDFTCFNGSEMVVVGSGQGGLEPATLLYEALNQLPGRSSAQPPMMEGRMILSLPFDTVEDILLPSKWSAEKQSSGG